MKKFIFWTIFLLIISGTVLFLGWVRVPENSMAIGFSTVTGYDTAFMKPGKLNWRWQKLIPKNYSTKFFPSEIHITDISVSQPLPSGELYSSVLANNPDLTYKVVYSTSYKIIEDALYQMVTSGHYTETSLDSFYSETEKRMQTTGTALMRNEIEKLLDNPENKLSEKALETALSKELAELIPEIEILSFVTVYSQFPDIEIYKAGKKKYMELLDMKQDILAKHEKANADFTSEVEKRLNLLQKYGKLLTEYPILIEYLKTKNESLLPDGLKLDDKF